MHAQSCPNRARPRIRPQIKGGPFDRDRPPVRRCPIPSGNEEAPVLGMLAGCRRRARDRIGRMTIAAVVRAPVHRIGPKPSRDAGACSQPRLPVYRIYHELPCARCSIAV